MEGCYKMFRSGHHAYLCATFEQRHAASDGAACGMRLSMGPKRAEAVGSSSDTVSAVCGHTRAPLSPRAQVQTRACPHRWRCHGAESGISPLPNARDAGCRRYGWSDKGKGTITPPSPIPTLTHRPPPSSTHGSPRVVIHASGRPP